MENASKALIIAGAILLAVLIISLGIMVYQNAKNTVGSTNLNEQEVASFNSKWQAYEGKTRTASEVTATYQAIIASNAAESNNKTNRFVTIEVDSTKTATSSTSVAASATNPTLTAPSVDNSKSYTVVCDYSSQGLVSKIRFFANT